MARSRRYAEIPPQRRDAIAELAESIADRACPVLPVRPDVILKEKGITTSAGDYGDTFDGLLELKDGRFHVYCNLARVEYEGSARARFTVGHELGHYFIDEHRNALLAGTPPHESKADFSSDNPIEQEADLFASHLLMPTGLFVAAATKADASLNGVVRLAATFATSITSTAIRYAKLGIRPCVVIRWGAEGYAWKWLSPQVHRSKLWKTVEEVERVPTDSPTGKILAAESAPAGILSAGSTAATWFPFVHAGSGRDALLMEYAMSLGRFGALTMLFPIDGGFE
jgi:hypothetical protein